MLFLKEQLEGIWQFLRRNSSETLIIIFATLFITLDHYHPVKNDWLSSFIYFALAPILVMFIVLRKNPLDFGLKPGSPRIWGKYLLVICPVTAAILFATSFLPVMQSYYKVENFNFINYFLTIGVTLLAQEFFYRGFLIFGLKEKLKEASILLQMIPFALLHLCKPELETVSTVLTGILFGYIA